MSDVDPRCRVPDPCCDCEVCCKCDEPRLCPDCGREEGSFACKIRHIQLNTGWAKSAND